MTPGEVSHSIGDRTSEADDGSLVRRCQQGDLEAFDQLVLRHQRRAFAVALRWLGDYHEAHDVTQDALIQAYRGLGRFRGEAKFSTWLLTIVINCCRNRRRWWARRKRVMAASLDEPVDAEDDSPARQVADPSPSPAADAMSAELKMQVTAALQRLDEQGRTVVVLRDIQGLSYEEIAQVLRCRVGTVKSRLSRARLRLRALMDGRL